MSLTEQLLADVHDFAIDLGITESLVGTRAIGDSQIIARLRAGRSIQLRNADRIYSYMAAERLRRAEIGAQRPTAAEQGNGAVSPWARLRAWLGRGSA